MSLRSLEICECDVVRPSGRLVRMGSLQLERAEETVSSTAIAVRSAAELLLAHLR